ncbi:nicotinamide N-methyltransferase [Coprinopsis sp. MPI-PUGE-AT-0042]|nr:nicotinamide N-methyltransferase [Coprinopsis sp. MPI-PUGE-AT-0042]
MSDSEDIDLSLDSVFPEPPRPPTPPPTTSTYRRKEWLVTDKSTWKELRIRLVGDHPLWGHYLWNAARSFATYLDEHSDIYKDRNVLELGAGGALPSLVAAKNDAQFVVITDYPDTSLIDNIEYNVKDNLAEEERRKVLAKGYIWGQATASLLDSAESATGKRNFDLVILSDLVFNHSQHDALLTTCENVITPPSATVGVPEDQHTQPCVLVFYSHHRPHFAHRDMEFFSKAEQRGWKVEKVVEEKFPVMFPEDSGDEGVRSTVHGWRLTQNDL